MTHALEFSILGRPRAWLDGEAVPLGRPQQQATLAMLLMHRGTAVSMGQMVDGVCGEAPPSRAPHMIRTYVWRLRRALRGTAGTASGTADPASAPDRDQVIVTAGNGYLIRVDEDRLDAARAERLERQAAACRAQDPGRAQRLLAEALALWQGEPLAGVPGAFAARQRLRLEEQRLLLLHRRLEAELALGRHKDAVPELLHLTETYPLREGFRAQLMLALYRAGRQAEALRVYTDTRELLDTELGIAPGPELRDLHLRILGADPALATPSHGARPPVRAASRPPVPAQLPCPPADFVGRAGQLERLLSLPDEEGRTGAAVAVVCGMPGMGTSAFALHAAHRLRPHYPDGQLYADLRESAEPALVLRSFLTALGVAPLPADPEELAALFRSALADRRLLVLLDNAPCTAELRPLLPAGPGCAVVIAGRGPLPGLAGATRVHLPLFGEEEALRLLSRVAGPDRVAAEPDAARRLVTAAAGLPLAVRSLAARLAARPAWTPASLAARTGDERRRLAELRVGDLDVPSAFAADYTRLDAEHARAFRLFALAARPHLPADAGAALLARTTERAEALLEALVDAGLLTSPAPGAYDCHPLLRLYGQERCRAEETGFQREAALRRLREYEARSPLAAVVALSA
ncbi:BTAD domain-containing putative transcriptional regulator [Streptomyces gamaensis]|uniref:BTAD domain-containing putative transcriptional regulator n=1 Tax=Streptomyces gamaensis TaxID=1763542 RepID=A0ABW0Z0R6_9ACTN